MQISIVSKMSSMTTEGVVNTLLSLQREAKQNNTTESPLVVHCL